MKKGKRPDAQIELQGTTVAVIDARERFTVLSGQGEQLPCGSLRCKGTLRRFNRWEGEEWCDYCGERRPPAVDVEAADARLHEILALAQEIKAEGSADSDDQAYEMAALFYEEMEITSTELGQVAYPLARMDHARVEERPNGVVVCRDDETGNSQIFLSWREVGNVGLALRVMAGYKRLVREVLSGPEAAPALAA